MPTYTDTFNRAGNLVGSTETGGGTWQNTGSGTPSTNGSYLQHTVSGQFSYLDVGTGDVDVTALILGSGTLAVRKDSGTQRAYRVRVTSRTVPSGGYVTVPQYVATWYHSFCENMNSYEYQCNNSSFPQIVAITCYNGKGNVSGYKSLQSVVQSGTCQQYQSSSYTVYSATFERVAADGTVTELGTAQTSYSATIRIVAQGKRVQAYAGGTSIASATDEDSASLAASRHGLGSTGTGYYDEFSLTTLNVAPDQPLVDAPANASIVDRTADLLVDWTFVDPDPADAQSKFDLSVKPTGGTATITTSTSTVTATTIPAGTLAAGTYELAVRTYDSQGIASPWSATVYFTAGDPPASPTITTPPTDGSAIPTELFAVEWSTPTQDAYQVRRVADSSGTANPATVYADTGPVAVAGTRRATLDFATNSRTEHVQVRIRSGGLWSTWASRRVRVSYTPPAQPYVVATSHEETGSIDVVVMNPAPQATQPTVLLVDLYRTGDRIAEERVASALVPAGGLVEWTDWTPASGRTYSYRAVALADNGTSSSS